MENPNEKVVWEMIELALLSSVCGLGYFAIYRLTNRTYKTSKEYATSFDLLLTDMSETKQIIKNFDQRFAELETEIKLQKSDSSRLMEWLDKERAIRDLERAEFVKSLRLVEREERIIQISEQLKLIRPSKQL